MDRNLQTGMTELQNGIGVKRSRSGQSARIDKPDTFLSDSLSKVGMAIQNGINTGRATLLKQACQAAFDTIAITMAEQQTDTRPLTDQLPGGC